MVHGQQHAAPCCKLEHAGFRVQRASSPMHSSGAGQPAKRHLACCLDARARCSSLLESPCGRRCELSTVAGVHRTAAHSRKHFHPPPALNPRRWSCPLDVLCEARLVGAQVLLQGLQGALHKRRGHDHQDHCAVLRHLQDVPCGGDALWEVHPLPTQCMQRVRLVAQRACPVPCGREFSRGALPASAGMQQAALGSNPGVSWVRRARILLT